MRIDVFLVEKGFCSSRNKAKDLLLKGGVFVNGSVVLRPSTVVLDNDLVEVNDEAVMPYVSKGGLKLQKAINDFELDFNDKYVIDIGASTGGFTDCALKHGAKFVWAIDVGSAQLHHSLLNDKRVQAMENADFRDVALLSVGRKVDAVIGDLSFISLKHILRHIPKFLEPKSFVVLLIKPQFEVGPENINKGGVVKNPKMHIKAIKEIEKEAESCGLYLSKLTPVPLIDMKKNIEYLALFYENFANVVNIEQVVSEAFART